MMDNTINGRTPEEIKKGLECCKSNPTCSLCPYDNEDDCQVMESDALAYIQQLEDGIKLLRAYNKGTLQKIVQLERERDAAVEQLTETSNEIGSCKGCVRYTNPGYKCYLWEANENCYEWCGVQEEVKPDEQVRT